MSIEDETEKTFCVEFPGGYFRLCAGQPEFDEDFDDSPAFPSMEDAMEWNDDNNPGIEFVMIDSWGFTNEYDSDGDIVIDNFDGDEDEDED